jgi:hypothetical protein
MQDVVIEPVRMQSNGRVDFEWHPATGELSFADETALAVTRRADASSTFSRPQPLAMQSCGSR